MHEVFATALAWARQPQCASAQWHSARAIAFGLQPHLAVGLQLGLGERERERKKERKMACWDSGLERVSLASNGHALHSGIPALGTNQGAARLAGAPLNRDLPSVRRPWNDSCTTFPSSSVRLGRASMMTDSEFRILFVLSFALCCSRFLVIYIPRQAPNTVSPRCHMEVGLHSNRRARP